jgi:competence protein ComEC
MWNSWTKFPITRVTLIFLVGIYLFQWLPALGGATISICAGLLFLIHLVLTHQRKVPYYNLGSWVAWPALIVILLLGYHRAALNDQLLDPSHYRHIAHGQGWKGTITTPGIAKENFILYEAEINSVFTNNATVGARGKFNFYVRKTDSLTMLDYGDQLIVQGMPYEIPSPKNPDEFNYSGYMRIKHIYDQQFVDVSEIKSLGNNAPNPILAAGYKLRSYLQGRITHHLGQTAESAVFSALILGIKDHLENDLTKAYASAGAMHVLAVSGLHVGIVFLILNYLLKPLKQLPHGNWIVFCLHLFGLWSYALITGFSPSVLRAVTMFSIVTLAGTSARSSNIYNTIALSALILLLREPNFIFAVGFQLSYAAVLGIIYLQPKIYNLWIPKYRLIDWAWQITAVSVAAQMATFPLGLYYFHQFPSYFFISNLLVIPAVGLILHVGLGFLLGSTIHESIGDIIAPVLEGLLWTLNAVVDLAEKLPGSLIDWVYLSADQMFLVYGVLLTIILVFHYQNLRWLYLSFALGCVFSYSYIDQYISSREAIAIKYYRAKNYPAIDFYHQGESYLVSSPEFVNSELAAFQIDPHRRAVLSNPVYQDELPPNLLSQELEPGITLYQWFDHRIIHVTKRPQQKYSPPLTCDQLVISNNAIEYPNQLEQFSFDQAIVDGSNFQSRRMLQLIEKAGLHNLNVEGAHFTMIDPPSRR